MARTQSQNAPRLVERAPMILANDWGRILGFPTRRRTPAAEDYGDMKKAALISLAVFALLVLALGGWIVKSVRPTPAYA